MSDEQEPFDYQSAADQIGLVATFVEHMNIDGVLDEIRHAHAVGPIVHPTEYRRGMGNLEHVERLARPLRTFQRAVIELKAELAARQATVAP